MKKAIIFGITGQDGAYLTNLLLNKDYEVHGVKEGIQIWVQPVGLIIFIKILYKIKQIYFCNGDITDASNVTSLISEIQPDEIYNLSAQSHVAVSFVIPSYTAQVDAVGCTNILEAIRTLKLTNNTKFYQASTSELYGDVIETPQNENTPFNPQSPYSIAKQYSFWMTKLYREAYEMHASNGILLIMNLL